MSTTNTGNTPPTPTPTTTVTPPPPPTDVMQQLSPLENLGLGCLAGIGTKLVNYPLLVWKNQSQQGLPLVFNPKLLYRGLTMACINLGGTTAIQFWFVGLFQGVFKREGQPLTPTQEMGSAFMGGLASGVPCSMLELTMIQQQRFGGSIAGTPTRLVSDLGMRALSRGMLPTLGRESLYTMAMLGMAPVMQRELHTTYGLQPDVALGVGALLSSVFSATLSHPMDTIKTCMQGDVEQKKYPGALGTAKVLTAEYGVANGLFKGLVWRIALISTTFFFVNKFKVVLAPAVFGDKSEDKEVM